MNARYRALWTRLHNLNYRVWRDTGMPLWMPR